MAAATLVDLTNWIETYAGPIIDAAQLVADFGPSGLGPPLATDAASDDKRSPLVELAHRIKVARDAGQLPAPYTGPRGARPSIVGQNWAASIANWLVTWNWPSW